MGSNNECVGQHARWQRGLQTTDNGQRSYGTILRNSPHNSRFYSIVLCNLLPTDESTRH
jgi:hypothetical protein